MLVLTQVANIIDACVVTFRDEATQQMHLFEAKKRATATFKLIRKAEDLSLAFERTRRIQRDLLHFAQDPETQKALSLQPPHLAAKHGTHAARRVMMRHILADSPSYTHTHSPAGVHGEGVDEEAVTPQVEPPPPSPTREIGSRRSSCDSTPSEPGATQVYIYISLRLHIHISGIVPAYIYIYIYIVVGVGVGV